MQEHALAERLITYDTSNLEGIQSAAGFIKGWLESRDVDVSVGSHNGRPVIAATVGAAAGAGPTVILHGHADVVPGRPEQFVPRVDGDRLYGRGAYDMKGGLAAMMVATRDLAAQEAVRVHFVCVCDEESDEATQRGSDYLVEQGYTGDFAITGEPTDMHIGVQAKGVLAMRIEVTGKAAHGSTPWLGDNAVLKAVDVFRQIESLPFARESSEFFDRPSISLGRIVGGDAINKVPDLCAIDVDVRYLPGQDAEQILADVSAIPDVHVSKVFRRAPAIVERTNPVRAAAGGGDRRGHAHRAHLGGPRRHLGCDQLHRGGHPRGRVRTRGRRPPRAGGVGLDFVTPPLQPGHRGVCTPDSRPPDHGTPSHCLTRSHAETDSGSASCWERS